MSLQDEDYEDDHFDPSDHGDQNEDPESNLKFERDNEYYNFLHIPRDATQEEITAAYKKYSRMYHPDKFLNEDQKVHANEMFSRLQNVYNVLNDPHKRALYDALGKEGVKREVTDLIPKNKTPKEIYEAFEKIRKQKEEEEMLRRTNPTSNLTVGINATDLFERYMYDETYDDFIEPSLPSIDVSEIGYAQTIDWKLSPTQTFTLSSDISTRRNTGEGSVGLSFRHLGTNYAWEQGSFSFGNGPSLSGSIFRILPAKTFATLTGSMQLYSNGLRPTVQVALRRSLGQRLEGSLNYTTSFGVQEFDDGWIIEEENAIMGAMLNYQGVGSGLSSNVKFGTLHSHILFNASKKLPNLPGTIRASFK